MSEGEVRLPPSPLAPSPASAPASSAGVTGVPVAPFCAHCGSRKPAAARFCPECGKSGTGSRAAGRAGDRAGRLASGVLDVGRSLVRDPIEGLRASYVRLDRDEAWWTSSALLAIGLLLAVVGVSIGAGRLSGGFVQIEVPFFATLFSLLATPLVLAAGSYALRRVATPGPHAPQADLFVAAAALLPIGCAVFLAGLLGMGNVEISSFLLFLGAILSVLMLFAGWTTVGGLPARFAAWLLPVLLALSLWAAKIVLFALSGF